ncbi:MAG: hypothetical protein ACE5JG_04755 [Planctomycetota bacterium]
MRVHSSGATAAESTLHCTEVYDRAVRETLFFVEAGAIRALSRVRPIEEDGTARDEGAAAAALRRIGLRRLLLVGALLLVGFGLMAWRTGYLDRLFSHAAEAIALDPGPFGQSLRLAVDESWGDYRLTVTRGPGFPGGPAELERRRAAATDLSRRAALDILAEGGRIYAQLCDSELRVLESAALELRPLLGDERAEVEVRIPGRIRARTIRLSLERGKRE